MSVCVCVHTHLPPPNSTQTGSSYTGILDILAGFVEGGDAGGGTLGKTWQHEPYKDRVTPS